MLAALGSFTVFWNEMTVSPTAQPSDRSARLFGNLGQGLLNQFRSYTIDFSRMQLTLGDHVQ